ncbi:Glutaminyl-peptide cyclotransferase-like protein [Dirofilaria immitis]
MFILQELNEFKVSYPPAEFRFHKSLLNKGLCDHYTLECIYYRSDHPRSKLSFDGKTGKRYNPCHRFVEPCFGISEHDYKAIKKFRSLTDY